MPLTLLLRELRRLFGALPRPPKHPVKLARPRSTAGPAREGVVTFTRKGVHGRMEIRSRMTDILFDLGPGFQGSLHAAGVGLGPLSKLDGRLSYGESGGDLAVVATHKSLVDRLMVPKARDVLHMFMTGRKILWRVSPAGFLLRIYSRPKATDRLKDWVNWAGILADLVTDLTGGPPAKLQMTAVRVAVTAETPCQICGSALDQGSRVECARCATPHHRDCWDFNGRCSTFACGSMSIVTGEVP